MSTKNKNFTKRHLGKIIYYYHNESPKVCVGVITNVPLEGSVCKWCECFNFKTKETNGVNFEDIDIISNKSINEKNIKTEYNTIGNL